MSTSTTSTNAPKSTRRGAKRWALTALAAVAVAGSLLAATPAQAATAAVPAGSMTICFKYQNGVPYTGAVTAAKYNGSQWVDTSTLASGSNGCRTLSTAAGYYFYFRMYINATYFNYSLGRMQGSIFSGGTPAILSTSGVNKSTTAVVYQTFV